MKIGVIIVCFFLRISCLYSQEDVVSAGGNINGNRGFSSLSIGQIVFESFSSEIGRVSQGVQQAYRIEVVIGNNLNTIQLLALAYPNSTMDLLHLNIENLGKQNLLYKFYNLQGKLIKDKGIISCITTISLKEHWLLPIC